MKVLFFSNIPVPYRMDFFNELGKYCKLTVLMETNAAKNLNAHWLKSYKVINYTLIFLPKIGKTSSNRINYGYHKIIKKGDYDIIIVGSYYSLSAMIFIEYLKLHRIPFILNSDGGFIKSDSWIKYKIKKHFISSADAYLSTGKLTTQYLLHYGAKKKIYVYPFTSMRKSEICKSRLISYNRLNIKTQNNIHEKHIILFVGQFIYRKGIDILIKALNNIDLNKNDIGVYIIGGEQKEEYENIINKKNIKRVHFVPFKTKQKLAIFYQIADLFVLPTREDIWGLVINEAMSYGLPIITTDKCIAGTELVTNYENGIIVPSNSPQNLENAMNYILNNENIMHDMGNNSLSKIKNYTIENMAKTHFEIFHDYLNNKHE